MPDEYNEESGQAYYAGSTEDVIRFCKALKTVRRQASEHRQLYENRRGHHQRDAERKLFPANQAL